MFAAGKQLQVNLNLNFLRFHKGTFLFSNTMAEDITECTHSIKHYTAITSEQPMYFQQLSEFASFTVNCISRLQE